MDKQQLRFLPVILILLTGGCGFYHANSDSNSATQAIDQATLSKNQLAYGDVQYIFNNSCVSCHSSASPSAGIATDNYNSVKANLSLISSAIANQVMPPKSGNPLSLLELQIIAKWVAQGAPQFASSSGGGGGVPTPTPASGTITASYQSISKNVLLPSCSGCHSNFSTYSSVKANISSIQDALLISKYMPPSGALPAAQLQAISDWIAAGSPQN